MCNYECIRTFPSRRIGVFRHHQFYKTSTGYTPWSNQAAVPHWLDTLGCRELNVDASYGN